MALSQNNLFILRRNTKFTTQKNRKIKKCFLYAIIIELLSKRSLVVVVIDLLTLRDKDDGLQRSSDHETLRIQWILRDHLKSTSWVDQVECEKKNEIKSTEKTEEVVC